MKKIVYALGIFAFMISCGQGTETESAGNDKPEETNVETEVVANESEAEPIEQNEVAEAATPAFVGNWEYHEKTIKLDVALTINADGTYSQQMGKTPKVEGTWKKISDNELVMKSPTLKKEGQKWEIKENTEDKLSICWNPDSENPKTIPFTRVK